MKKKKDLTPYQKELLKAYKGKLARSRGRLGIIVGLTECDDFLIGIIGNRVGWYRNGLRKSDYISKKDQKLYKHFWVVSMSNVLYPKTN